MPIPNRTTAAHYHYHVYNYAGSAPFQLSAAMGVAGHQMQFYSLFQDLQQLVIEANAKNMNAMLLPILPPTNPGRRPILVLRFGGGGPNRRVLFTGGIHGRERIAVEMPYLIAEYLIKNYPDPAAAAAPTARELVIRRLVDHRQIFVAPMLNPDGHTHATLHDRNWRINRRAFVRAVDFHLNNGYSIAAPNLRYFANQHNPPPGAPSPRQIDFDPNNVTAGVDLNRNFPGPKWGYECYHHVGNPPLRITSGDPVARVPERDTYFGPFVNSEPETQAVMQLFAFGPFLASIDYHSYAQMILYPERARRDGDVKRMAQCLHWLIGDGAGNNYAYGRASQLLYPAFSSVMDYSYQTAPHGLLARKPYAFTVELDPALGAAPGFNWPENQILNTFRKNIRGALALLACAGKYLVRIGTPQCCGQFANWDVYNHGNDLP